MIKIIRTFQLLFTYFNFKIIPGEIVPYYAIQRRYFSYGIYLILVFLLILLFKLAILSIYNHKDLFDYLINGIELIFVILIVSSIRLSDSNELEILKFILYFSFLYYFGVLMFPSIEVIKLSLMTRGSTIESLAANSRGFSFLASEPSYAGTFFLGLLMLANQLKASPWIQFGYATLILITASIWALALLLVFAISQIKVNSLYLLIGVFFIVLVIMYSDITAKVLSYASPRVADIFELVVSNNFLINIIELEGQYGSNRLRLNFYAFEGFIPFNAFNYENTYSFISQAIIVFGTLMGSILTILLFILILSQVPTNNFIRLGWVFLIVGPVITPTIYLIFRKMNN
tara:strand:- start:1116 stop:2150 length:1035 start_codon:yes stop_codon:yes gene_type:complete